MLRPIRQQLHGIQHIGISVENMPQSLEFYTEVLGGDLLVQAQGIEGEAIQNILFQKEELEALSTGIPPLLLGVPNLREGKQKVDLCLIQFENVVLELLYYHDSTSPSDKPLHFPLKHAVNSPAFVNAEHVSFFLHEEVDADAFAAQLEAECQRRGLPQIKCNRCVRVYSEEERQTVQPETYSYKIPGDFEGWTMIYCKGPSGEQLEFTQLRGKAKKLFLKHAENAVLDDQELQAGLRRLHPQFGDLCTRVAGEVWGLPLIDQKTKAFLTLAIDIVNQTPLAAGSPFEAHVTMAKKQGATQEELEELLLFLCAYAGFNKVASYFGKLKEIYNKN